MEEDDGWQVSNVCDRGRRGIYRHAFTGWHLGARRPATAGGHDHTVGGTPIPALAVIPAPSAQMSAIRSARGSQSRLRETIKLVQSLSPAELRAWLEERRFAIRGGFELLLFRKIAEERFARLDPEMYAEWDHRRGGDRMLREWAERDPQRLLEFARTHPRDHPRLDDAWTELAKHHPEAAIQYLQESALAGYRDPSRIFSWLALREILHRSPAALESALETLPSPWRRKAEDIKLADALTDSPGPTMEALYQSPDGWDSFRRAHFDADPGELLLEEIATLPASWKAALAAGPGNLIRRESAQRWAEADLEGAGFHAGASRGDPRGDEAVTTIRERAEISKNPAGVSQGTPAFPPVLLRSCNRAAWRFPRDRADPFGRRSRHSART